jgi:hypothetical protein
VFGATLLRRIDDRQCALQALVRIAGAAGPREPSTPGSNPHAGASYARKAVCAEAYFRTLST